MTNSVFRLPDAYNEPILNYAPGSKEKALLKKELERQLSIQLEIPLIIGGKEVFTGKTQRAVCPDNHKHTLAIYHEAGEAEVRMAVEAALEAKKTWEFMPWEERAAIFLKAASLISTKYRYILNAATMLNQSKNVFQAEIDATCEVADFFRCNVKFMEEIYSNQPRNDIHTWNRMEYRPLEGFIFAVTPFNFTAIGANLTVSPAMMGNTIVWKPASTSVLSNYYLMQLFKEAGLPDGVINFIPGRGSVLGKVVMNHPELAGVHFTGSTGVFNQMWKTVAENLEKYKVYPRLVGETGGKDYIFVHNSADMEAAAASIIRGAFEYQGQKCSACSRVYAPKSKWAELKDLVLNMASKIKTGTVLDFTNFMNACIDESSFDATMKYINTAKDSSEAKIISGGNGDKSVGYFIDPTIIETTNPHFVTMEEEIFAPVLTIFVYDDTNLDAAIETLDKTSPYALTGAIFATDRGVINYLTNKLTATAGNFYVNDKCTGAAVGLQPFGGARMSGTNDKAGSFLNLVRWTSARTIKENFVPSRSFEYPFMEEK